jgi:hypothetical protein
LGRRFLTNPKKGNSMTTPINNASVYVPAPTKKQKLLNGFVMLGCASVITAIGLGTATFNQRIDIAKEKMVYGYELSEKDAEIENSKIIASSRALTYYCNTHQNNPKCNSFNNSTQPLGDIQKVAYTPNMPLRIAIHKTKIKPFSWKANKMPPMPKSGLYQQVKMHSKKDDINNIIAENNLKNVIKAGY